jgi:YcxB-like protein
MSDKMSASTPNGLSVTITTRPTFLELFVASLVLARVLIRYRWQSIIPHAISLLAGVFLLVAPLVTGERFQVLQFLLALLAFSYTPLCAAIAAWTVRRNLFAQGACTYSFDSEGMNIKRELFSQKILWAAIPRIHRSRRFLFIFIGPATAFYIPLKVISAPRFLDDLRSIAVGRTDFFCPNNSQQPIATAN